jgi:hypothetical protein
MIHTEFEFEFPKKHTALLQKSFNNYGIKHGIGVDIIIKRSGILKSTCLFKAIGEKETVDKAVDSMKSLLQLVSSPMYW